MPARRTAWRTHDETFLTLGAAPPAPELSPASRAAGKAWRRRGMVLVALAVLAALSSTVFPVDRTPLRVETGGDTAQPLAPAPVDEHAPPVAPLPELAPAAPAVPAGPALSVDDLAAVHRRLLEAAGPGTLEAVQEYLASRRRILMTVLAGAFTGDGTVQLLLSGAGARCASCHARWIAIWDAGRQALLWEADDGVDTVVTLTPDGRGFERSDTVPVEGEPRCCPSQRLVQTLVWDGAAFAVTQSAVVDARPD